MKFALSAEDMKRITAHDKTNQTNRYLEYKKNGPKFKIGDVLIRKKHYSATRGWETEMVSDRSNVPKKFYYVHENENGVGYVKQIKSDGSSLCD